MSGLDAKAATSRWIFLGLLTVVVAAISYVAVEASGWKLRDVPAGFAIGTGAGCVFVVVVLVVRSRRSRPTGGIGLRLDRLDRLATPTTPPDTGDSRREIDSSDVHDPSDVTSEPAEMDSGDVGDERISTGSLQNPGNRLGDAEPDIRVQAPNSRSVRSTPSQPMPASVPLSPRDCSSMPPNSAVHDADIGDTGFDAMRLATVLNRYEQVGIQDKRHPSQGAPTLSRDGDALGERGLWDDLVTAYGAESIDLRDIGTGRCRITLRSGNLVLYVPEYHRWVWLVFGRTVAAQPDVSDESGVEQGVRDSVPDTEKAPMPAAGPEPLAAQNESGGYEETENGLMRLARSKLGQIRSIPKPDSRTVRVVIMAQVLSSQNTPAAYEEALFVTEGLLFGAAYGNRVVPYEELVWVVEAATGHIMQMQSMSRFLGDLVERSYPRHMDVLSALAIPSSPVSQPTIDDRETARLAASQSEDGNVNAAEGTVIDLTDTGMQSRHEAAASHPS